MLIEFFVFFLEIISLLIVLLACCLSARQTIKNEKYIKHLIYWTFVAHFLTLIRESHKVYKWRLSRGPTQTNNCQYCLLIAQIMTIMMCLNHFVISRSDSSLTLFNWNCLHSISRSAEWVYSLIHSFNHTRAKFTNLIIIDYRIIA